MAWIESHTELERHPKLMQLKRRMRWSRNETVGFLHRFWWTVMEYASSGMFVLSANVPNAVTSSLPLEVIAESLDVDEKIISSAMEQMVDLRLLHKFEDVYVVHDWLSYTWIYLRDWKYKRDKTRLESIRAAHEAFGMQAPNPSAESPQTVYRHSGQPTNQPNQPTPSGGRKKSARDLEVDAALEARLQRHAEQKGDVEL